MRVSAEGYVRPAAKGEADIVIEAAGQRQTVHVVVRDASADRPLHFANDIEPLLSRHGCNAGGCHGRASGQNGFKLSLFGFDPVFDYNALVKEARGRRVFPGAPDSSLVLMKAAGLVAHGGGKRLLPGSDDYHTLRRWIAQGTPIGDREAPTLKRLTITPGQRVLDRGAGQQLAVLAHYSDGSVRDVTRQAQFQSNETSVAGVDGDGLVRTFDLSGEAAVMARYMGQVCRLPRPRAARQAARGVARFPPEQLHRRTGAGALEAARHRAVRSLHRQRVRPPRAARPVRPAADARRGACVPAPTSGPTDGTS